MTQRRRVVYLNPCAQMGGAETSLCELLSAVRQSRPSLDLILILSEDGPLVQRVAECGVTVHVLPFPPLLQELGEGTLKRYTLVERIRYVVSAAKSCVHYLRHLRTLLREIEPDLIHTNGFKMHGLAVWASSFSVPLIWHLHDYVSTRSLMKWLLRVHSWRPSAIVVNSNSVAQDLETVCSHRRIRTIYNAIDLTRFQEVGSELDLDSLSSLVPPRTGTVRIGLPATFAHWKGHLVFLQALAKLPSAASIRGYIMGGPIYKTSGSQRTFEELKQEVSRLGLMEKVGFTGFLPKLEEGLRSLDIVVHASTAPEPFGMVIIEAMACRKAVVVSRAGGACELYEEEQTAVSFEPGNADQLARQIHRLILNPPLRQQLGDSAAQSVSKRFNRNQLAAALLSLYDEVWGSPK